MPDFQVIRALSALLLFGVLLAPACGGDKGPYAGPCVVEEDEGVDGVVDRRDTYTYRKGRVVLVEFDDDADGEVDSVWVFEYAGGVLRREVDGDPPDGANGTEYLYDEDELLVQLGYDDDGDAVADRGHRYVNDASGFVRTHEYYEDFAGDPSWVDEHTYDAAGYLVRIDHDVDADGTVDDVIRHSWNEDHTDELVEEDRGDDGVVEATHHATYDADGNQTLYETDWDGDTVWDRRDAYEYVEGRHTRTETDEGADGVLEAIQIYQYNDRGDRILAAYYDGNQVPLLRDFYSYDGRGNLVRMERQDGVGALLGVTDYDYRCWK